MAENSILSVQYWKVSQKWILLVFYSVTRGLQTCWMPPTSVSYNPKIMNHPYITSSYFFLGGEGYESNILYCWRWEGREKGFHVNLLILYYELRWGVGELRPRAKIGTSIWRSSQSAFQQSTGNDISGYHKQHYCQTPLRTCTPNWTSVGRRRSWLCLPPIKTNNNK